MQNYKTLARPYANALFSIAKEEKTVDLFLDFLKNSLLILKNPDLVKLNKDPFSSSKLSEIIIFVFEKSSFAKQNEKKLFYNFLKILGQKKKIKLLDNIFLLFKKLKNEQKNIDNVYITSSFDLSEDEKNNLLKILEKKLNKKLNLILNIDTSLISGVVIKIGDKLIDMSYKKQLEKLDFVITH